MTVPAGKTLVLQGPMDLRADTFELLSGAQLIIDTTAGPVGMYTTRLTYFESGSSLVSVDKDPTRFTLFALTPVRTDRSKVIMGAKGEFYGMLIAPARTSRFRGTCASPARSWPRPSTSARMPR
ncbi:MAG: hypothetical protein R3F17_01930 [Planctomycetota bacterium]